MVRAALVAAAAVAYLLKTYSFAKKHSLYYSFIPHLKPQIELELERQPLIEKEGQIERRDKVGIFFWLFQPIR